ncbi:MAG: hypothetical protein ABI593_09130 [Betaproteobacteria bacterium]
MKRTSIATIALIAGLGLAGTAFGQRHDEKSHGYNAPAAAAAKTEVATPAPGRHDEKPHGVTKKSAPAKVAAKSGAAPAAEAPAVKPDATKTAP